MKSLLLFLIIYTLQDFARSQDGPPIMYKSYPKKVFLDEDNIKFINTEAAYKKYSKLKREPFTRFAPPPIRTQKKMDSFFLPEFYGDLKSRVKKVAFFSDREVGSRSKRDVSNTTLTVQTKSTTKKPTTTKKQSEKSKITVKAVPTTKLTVKSNTSKAPVSPNRRSASEGSSSPKASNSPKGSTLPKVIKTKSITKKTVPRPRQIQLIDAKPIARNMPTVHKTKNPRNKRGRKTKPAPKGQKRSGSQKTKASKVDGRRLIAARDARPEDYPYVVSIQKDGQHWCTGAILNEQLIISTANCFWKSSAVSRMRVRAGARSIDRGGQVAKIAEVRKHPKWSLRKNPDCDLALALLNKYLKFSDSVHSVDLPNIAMLPPFDDAWVSSYGAERRDGIFNRLRLSLQVTYVKLMSMELCNNITMRFNVPLTDNFICLSQQGRRAPCTRDTGAPAVSDGVLWGLASWGIRKLCGTERFPAMFSYTASKDNIEFITNVTSDLMSERRIHKFLDRERPYGQSGVYGAP